MIIAIVASQNRQVVDQTDGHRSWERVGKGLRSDPFKFDISGHPHEAMRKAIIEASARTDGTAYFMLGKRKMMVHLPKLQEIDSNWILRLRHDLFVKQNDIKMPSEKSSTGRILLLNTTGMEFLEVHVKNA
jgi:hypothetical protein